MCIFGSISSNRSGASHRFHAPAFEDFRTLPFKGRLFFNNDTTEIYNIDSFNFISLGSDKSKDDEVPIRPVNVESKDQKKNQLHLFVRFLKEVWTTSSPQLLLNTKALIAVM